jgi:AraC family transcriptional regulator
MIQPPNIHAYQDQIRQIQRYVRDHLDEPLHRKRLAQIGGFSVPHMHRVFTACAQESMADYIRRMRMQRAGQKLRMGAVDITEVALAAGYATHAAFSKAFKQHFGITPSAFRQLGCYAATCSWNRTQIIQR